MYASATERFHYHSRPRAAQIETGGVPGEHTNEFERKLHIDSQWRSIHRPRRGPTPMCDSEAVLRVIAIAEFEKNTKEVH